MGYYSLLRFKRKSDARRDLDREHYPRMHVRILYVLTPLGGRSTSPEQYLRSLLVPNILTPNIVSDPSTGSQEPDALLYPRSTVT